MKKMGINDELVTTVLLPCLRLFIGGGEPFRITYAYELKSAFTHIRTILLQNNFFRRVRGVLTTRSDYLIDKNDSENENIMRRPVSGSVVDILFSICMFMVGVDYHLNYTVKNNINNLKNNDNLKNNNAMKNYDNYGNLKKENNNNNNNLNNSNSLEPILVFSSEILTVPMVTLLLSVEGTYLH